VSDGASQDHVALLARGERQLWSGAPAQRSVVWSDIYPSFKILVGAVLGVAVLILGTMDQEGAVMWSVAVPAVVFVSIVAAALAARLVLNVRRRRRTVYVITNQRAIVNVGDRIRWCGPEFVRAAVLRDNGDGTGTIRFGVAVMGQPASDILEFRDIRDASQVLTIARGVGESGTDADSPWSSASGPSALRVVDWMIVGLAALLAVVGCVVYWKVQVDPQLTMRRSWQNVPCEIVSSRVRATLSPSSGVTPRTLSSTTYRVEVVYRFEHQGRQVFGDSYESNPVSRGGAGAYRAAAAEVAGMPPGRRTSCWVDPATGNSVMHLTSNWWLMTGLIPLTIALMGGVVGLYLWRRSRSRAARNVAQFST
jgi:hypothetical protein